MNKQDEKTTNTYASDSTPSNKKTITRVLHVDDDLCFLEVSKQILSIENNYEIDNATSVADAFKKMEQQSYDVIVSDYEMPQKDGLQFLTELREQKNGIPFMLFTGKGREEVAIKALNLGADGYYNKQGDPETVYGELAYGILRVTEKERAKHALNESEKRYRNLMESASEAIFVHDLKGKIVDANWQACKNLGYTKEELLSMNASEVDVEAAEDKTGGDFWSKVIKGETVRFQSTHRRKDQSIFPVEVSLRGLTIGEDIFVMAMVQDISLRKKAEEELKQKYDVLERVGESVGAGLAIIGKEYNIIWANERLRNIIVSLNKKCYQNFNKSESVCPDCGVKKVFEQNKSLDVHEYKTVNSKGETVWIELRVTPLKDKNGNIIAALELAVPISERKKAEQESIEKETKYQNIFNNSEVGMFRTRFDGSEILDCNEKYLSIFGWKREEMLGKNTVIFWADPNERKEMVRLLQANGSVKDFECKMLNKHNESRACLTSVKLYSEQGILEGSIMDITERKKIETDLKSSLAKEHFFAELIRNASIAIAVAYPDGRLLMGNNAFQELTGYPEEELKKITWNETLTPPEWREHEIKMLEEISRSKKAGVYRKEYIRKDGSIIPIEVVTHPSFDDKGKVTYFFGFITDITERKKAEKSLHESQVLTQKMLFCSPNLIYIYDLQKNCNIYSNKEVLTFLGYTPEQVKTMGAELFSNILHPDDAQIVANHHALFKNAPDNATYEVDYRMKHASGEWRWLRSRDTLFARTADGLGKQILGMSEDITERKKVKETLRKGMERYRELADSLPEIIFETDINGVLTYANRSAFEMMDYTSEDLAKGFSAFDLVDQKDKEKAKDHFSKTLASNSSVDNEYTCVKKNGSTFPTIIVSKSIMGENGPVGLRGVAMDITQRKEAEEEQKKGQAKIEVMNEKLRVVGGLTRHDLSNKLMTIKANTYLLAKRAGNNPELTKYLEGIDSALHGADQIIEFGRAYEKIGSEELTNMHVEACFNEAAALFPELLGINAINESQGLTVLADSLLRQLLYNLIDNSLKHGEKVTQIRLHYNKNGDGVKLYYEDDGVGISKENKPKLFAESFTTSNGSGLGLRLIKKIMEVYGWTITEEGKPGIGAKFVITIPRFNQTGKVNYRINSVFGE